MHPDERSSITKLYVRKDKAAVILLSYRKLSNKSKNRSVHNLGIAQETISSIHSVALADVTNTAQNLANRYKYIFLLCIHIYIYLYILIYIYICYFLNQSLGWESCTRADCFFSQNLENVTASDLTYGDYYFGVFEYILLIPVFNCIVSISLCLLIQRQLVDLQLSAVPMSLVYLSQNCSFASLPSVLNGHSLCC